MPLTRTEIMVSDFGELSRSLDEANETIYTSLHCAIFVLRQASQLPASQRRAMIEAVKELISVKESSSEEGPGGFGVIDEN